MDQALQSELGQLDGMGQAQWLKSGQGTASDLVEAAIARIERIDPALNAVVHRAFNEARAIAQSGHIPEGPFSGVPILAKNSAAPKGMPFDRSCRFLAGTVMAEQWPFNQAVLDSGAIFLGLTNSPELGLLGTTEPAMYGITNNPWSPKHGPELSPGGSSGGSAVAVASGMVPIGTAGDGAGSIRIPAAHCGLVGLKVSRSRDRGSDHEFLTNFGCVSRSVRDTAAFAAATETLAPVDMQPIGRITGPSKQRLKIAFSTRGHFGEEPESSVGQVTRAAAGLLEGLGHQVSEQWLDIDGELFWHHFMTLWSLEPALLVERASQGKHAPLDELFEPWALGLAEFFRTQRKPAAIEEAYAFLRGCQQQVRRFLQEFDVHMTPVVSHPPIPTGEQSATVAFDLLNERLSRYVSYTPLANAAGIPSISLPLFHNDAGLPVGTLFNAGFGQEARLLSLAYELEEARPWKDRWPALNAVR